VISWGSGTIWIASIALELCVPRSFARLDLNLIVVLIVNEQRGDLTLTSISAHAARNRGHTTKHFPTVAGETVNQNGPTAVAGREAGGRVGTPTRLDVWNQGVEERNIRTVRS